jgi:hypothetical protein
VGFVKFYEMTEKLKETVNRSVGQQQLFKSE